MQDKLIQVAAAAESALAEAAAHNVNAETVPSALSSRSAAVSRASSMKRRAVLPRVRSFIWANDQDLGLSKGRTPKCDHMGAVLKLCVNAYICLTSS